MYSTVHLSPLIHHSRLSQTPEEVGEDDLKTLETFVVKMYDPSSEITQVNEARLDMFARKQREYHSIPPTRAALLQHSQRAAYQAGHVWGQAIISNPQLPDPTDWGWICEGDCWLPLWSRLPPIASSCVELTKCGCRGDCLSRRCGCYRLGLQCTTLCNCRC